uniref:Murine leukemia virus integrase C-terminal domain-containing protein n=1 Tax=Labrus bergylta TaxID=56723 RepID=A0A3Q3FK85_9LABR
MEKVNTPFSHTALVKKPPPYEKETNAVQPGDKVFVKVFRRKWFNERREGPFEVVRSTGTAVQVKGSPTWYHLSHCVKCGSFDYQPEVYSLVLHHMNLNREIKPVVLPQSLQSTVWTLQSLTQQLHS